MQILNPLNEHTSAFPILQCIHILGIAWGVGTAALVNFRLLGGVRTSKTPAELWQSLMPWTLIGLGLAILAGLMLFTIDPEMYYNNEAFRIKMMILMLAIVFYYTVVRKTAQADLQGGKAAVVAYTSLLLWTLVPFGGIFIEFIGGTGYAYPALLAVHVVALISLGGMILATDLRWLGLAMPRFSLPDVLDALRVPKRIALAAAVGSGAVLFGLHAGQYVDSPWFWVKIALLVLIGANYLMFRRPASDPPKFAAVLSLALWAAVVFAARGPATIKDVMHSMVDPSGDFLFQSVQAISDDQGTRVKAPQTDEEWDGVRQRLMVLYNAPSLLDGRRGARPRDRSKNPEVENQPEQIQETLNADASDLMRRAHRLQDAASVSLKAVDAKDKDALLLGLDKIDKACESCHLHYWYPNDKRAQAAAKEDGIIE